MKNLLSLGLLLCLLSISTQAQELIHLWENGAPGFEQLKDEPEKSKDWWVKNIHNPSITVFKPEHPNGTAVLIAPGGGHRELVFDAEGKEAALFLNQLGITAFVLKYRLAREEGSPYELEKHPKQDAYRAIRLIRSEAKRWNIVPNRVGMMGFSAGGEVVNFIAFEEGVGNPDAEDPIDQEHGKPDFVIYIYPGPLGIPEQIPPNAPPSFLLAANGDECCSETVIKLLNGYREAGVSVEAHIYAKGAHAFNMGQRSEFKTISNWPDRLTNWLYDSGYLEN